jgi:disulfide bond formation protein DsbB
MTNTRLMGLSLIVVIIATLGSLYYGYFGDPIIALFDGVFWDKSKGLPPCQMCWFARILMYPIVITSLVGLVQKEFRSIALVQTILSGLGSLLMIYLYGMQKR